LGKSA